MEDRRPGQHPPLTPLLETRDGPRPLRRQDREAVLPRLQVRAEHPPAQRRGHGEELLDPRPGRGSVRSEIGPVPGGVAEADELHRRRRFRGGAAPSRMWVDHGVERATGGRDERPPRDVRQTGDVGGDAQGGRARHLGGGQGLVLPPWQVGHDLPGDRRGNGDDDVPGVDRIGSVGEGEPVGVGRAVVGDPVDPAVPAHGAGTEPVRHGLDEALHPVDRVEPVVLLVGRDSWRSSATRTAPTAGSGRRRCRP